MRCCQASVGSHEHLHSQECALDNKNIAKQPLENAVAQSLPFHGLENVMSSQLFSLTIMHLAQTLKE